MQRPPVTVASFSTAFLLFASIPAIAQDFHWHGSIAQGQAIEIKGINGDVVAEASGSNDVDVVAVKKARRSDPAGVQMQVLPHAGGVTICAVYPSRSGA